MLSDINDLLNINLRLTCERDDLLFRLNKAEETNLEIKQESLKGDLSNVEASKTPGAQPADQSYRKFIENMPEGVVTLLDDGTILYSNLSFSLITGLSLEKVIGSNLMDCIPAGYKAVVKKSIDEYQHNNSKFEISTLNLHGFRSHYIVSVRKLQLQDLMAISLVWTNVTDQKKVEAELISANQALQEAIYEQIASENKALALNEKLNTNIKILTDASVDLATFVHLASHDLQEPLRKLSTYSSLIAQQYSHAIDTQGVGYLNSLQNASLKMSRLIADVLEYITLSQNEALFSTIHLNTIIKQAISGFSGVINELKVSVVVEEDMPTIEADHSLVSILLKNLLSNSLKFKKPDIITEIRISVDIVNGLDIQVEGTNLTDEEFCVIYILDNGIGFNQDYTSQIFKAFKRLNSSFKYPGSGIGLAICKKIVEKHNGFITAESNIGEGSLFKVFLPVHQVTAWQIG